MGHFNLKSLIFYGSAIAGVLLLFSAVTAYGTANLKAPAVVDGRYPLSFAPNSPDCLKSDSLVLNIEQSGIYLNASLLPNKTNGKPATAAEKKPTLTGRLSNQLVSLTGPVKAKICHNAVSQPVTVQGQVEGTNLAGKMTLSSIPGDIRFTAQQEAPAEKSTSH